MDKADPRWKTHRKQIIEQAQRAAAIGLEAARAGRAAMLLKVVSREAESQADAWEALRRASASGSTRTLAVEVRRYKRRVK